MPETGTLEPRDPELFIKRLRKRSSLAKIGYFLCGEYGDTSDRPHYHAAVFGAPFMDKSQVGERTGYPVFRSLMLEQTWGLGHCEITPLNWKSASYVAGYVTKKAREKTDPVKHLRVNPLTGEIVSLQPEFQRMSRRPGLGRNWLEQYWTDVYPQDFVMINGSPFKPPRYYDRRMEHINPEIMEEVRYQRYLDAEEIDDEQLIMKEKVHRSRLKLFSNRGKV